MEVNILNEILATKRKEIEGRTKPDFINSSNNYLTFKDTIESGKKFIAEFKRKSPSAGWIAEQGSVVPVLKSYQSQIADLAGFSVLTDEPYFGGSLQDLAEARNHFNLPLLRKDFIIDEIQLIEAKNSGASTVLLIAAALSASRIKTLIDEAKNLHLEVLLEVKDKEEIKKYDERIELLGVNNRDLRTFNTDYKKSIELAPHLPNHPIWISESGLSTTDQFRELEEHGFQGFLVGQSFMEKYA